MNSMTVFEKLYTLNMIGNIIKVGDITPIGNGHSVHVVGITKLSIDEVYIRVEGYGILTEY